MESATISPSTSAKTARHAAPAAGPRTTWILALSGGLLLWAALPPLDLWPLAWIATIPWLVLIQRPHLPGTRPYRALWTAGFVFWLLAVHWLRLPHWATHFGWLALSFYLAFYLPVFVGLSRVGVHRLGLSIVVVAPLVWTGLELARSHLLTGFMMAGLGHTQYRWVHLIQVSDVAGAYAVSFMVVFAPACLVRLWAGKHSRPSLWPLVPLFGVMGGALIYGKMRLVEETGRPGPRVALIQGSIDADWKADDAREKQITEEYFRLSRQAREEAGQRLDLIVWPETMYRGRLYTFSDDYQNPGNAPYQSTLAEAATRRQIAGLARELDTPLLLGIDIWHFSPRGMRRFNSAVGTDRGGKIEGRYDKMHLVMFGEYVPFAERFPWLYGLTPLGGGLAVGDRPQAITLGNLNYAPNVCFESVLPHLIRGQVRSLARRGEEPDVLVNLTNDAWFWGSSELDMHLACAVFRAVECRKPFLIAANGGISASIDADGRIVEQAPRRQTDVILADVRLDSRKSVYVAWGDWPAGICLAGCLALAAIGLWDRRKSQLAHLPRL